ncbi:MAG: SagB family peptide dehydrogenase [Acidobacteriota bacterium]
MISSTLVKFRRDVSASECDGGIALIDPRTAPRWVERTPGLAAVIGVLATHGASEDELGEMSVQHEGPDGLARLYYYLRTWGERGLLRYTLAVGGAPWVEVEPMAGGWRFDVAPATPESRFRISRFAHCRWSRDGMIVESPVSTVRVTMLSPTAALLLATLAQPATAAEMCRVAANLGHALPVETAAAFLGMLAATGMAGSVDDAGQLAEDRDSTLAQWEGHDLLFHTRSRRGRHDGEWGATHRFAGSIPPQPVLKPAMPGRTIPLSAPDVDRLRHDDITLTAAIEDRRSLRTYGSSPITLEQLSELLYRVARVRKVGPAAPADGRGYQISDRPYPSGGAVYDLELYVAVNACAGLDTGLFHYDPLQHALVQIAGLDDKVQELLRDAESAAVLACSAQVLLVMSSRFQRASWKYSGSAYALTLKNAGVLCQSVYLVATAMHLAPCALGDGNSQLFARAAGLDYFQESSVAELLLGSAP